MKVNGTDNLCVIKEPRENVEGGGSRIGEGGKSRGEEEQRIKTRMKTAG